MSLEKYLCVKKKEEKIDNSKPSLFIQVLGGHCSGKSGIVGRLKEHFAEKICVVGKYKESKTNAGLLTGGMDGLKATNEERFNMIKKEFLSNKNVVITEGMMIIYHSSFMLKYLELQKERNRNILLVLLEADLSVIKERLHRRSKGKEFTDKRLAHIQSKVNTSRSTFDKMIEGKKLKKIAVKTNTLEDFDLIFNKLCETIERYL